MWGMSGKINLVCVLAVALSVTGFAAADQRTPTDSPAYKAAVLSRTSDDPNLIWTASQTALLAEEVAPGVYAVYPDTSRERNRAGRQVATSGGFVVGDNGVLVVDTMVNRRLAEQLMALIREKTNKPIRYIVNTSYHGDHSYGNMFFPEGVEIIQHRATRDYIRDHFPADITFMKKLFGSNQGLDELKGVPANLILEDGADISVDLGGTQVRIRHFGFAQTSGDLIVTAAEGKVLFTGNPVQAKEPAIPWLLDGHLIESIATMKALRDTASANVIVIPGHGAPSTIAAVQYQITYLEELRRQVEAAIAAGKSMEETVKAVTMTKYDGYKIYPWIHLQVNVPKAYDELRNK